MARIDTGSFSEKDIIAKTTFDERPSAANAQKRAFAQKVQDFIARENAAQYTDITGGLLQAVEFLNEKGTGRKTILIFSDLEQDLDKGYMRDIEVPFEGFDVVALNVVKLRQDNYDPRKYLARLEQWKGRVEKGGRTLARGERPRSAGRHVVREGRDRAQVSSHAFSAVGVATQDRFLLAGARGRRHFFLRDARHPGARTHFDRGVRLLEPVAR